MSSAESSSLVERLDALYEYDREPVDTRKLYGWRTFIAMFSSEHIAGTEFVLGVLLVGHGVSASDVFLGLALGNLLAVLSWALMCAPIAVKERLTIYWQLRKLAGPYLTVLYSGLFAIVLCLLAGAMVAVSTTAVAKVLQTTPLGEIWDFSSPNYAAGDRIPGLPWITIAILVGTVIAVLAVLGFEKLAHFAKVVAPWMPFVFLAGAIMSLPSLGVTGLGDFWEVANEKIWTGEPLAGQSKYGFWSCVGLAWLCNITQHMGMGDVTIFRYAKKWQMGFCSAFGMFLGHYMAWICSGIMCAAFVQSELAAGVETPNPTPANIALLGAGYAGIVCVVLAGWTTANPTLYRAGLALQVATPNWRRWAVTLAAGIVMIFTACIPAVLAFLDQIVAFYGILFMPLGAFIFIDFWVFPRLGLTRYYAERQGLLYSWPALLGWVGSFLISLVLYVKDNFTFPVEPGGFVQSIHDSLPFLQGNLVTFVQDEGQSFFLVTLSWINNFLPAFLADYRADFFMQVLPAWILAVTIYTVASVVQQKLFPAGSEKHASVLEPTHAPDDVAQHDATESSDSTTPAALRVASYLGLALSIVPALLRYTGTLEASTAYGAMIVGMLLWFGTAIWWIKPDHS